MDKALQGSFACRLRIPVASGAQSARYVLVMAVFRRIPLDSVNAWLMPHGQPRGDLELATDVLIEVQRISNDTHAPLQRYDLAEILQVDQAASLLVAAFLSALPQSGTNSEAVVVIQTPRH